MRRFFVGALPLAALLVSACQPALPELEGWRRPTAAEVKALKEARLADDPLDLPPVVEVRGDFNADGRGDRAVLMVSDSQDTFAPYVFDGAGGEPVELTRGDVRSRMFRYNLAVLPPLAVYGFCQEQADDDAACERHKDRKGQVIVFFEAGRGGSLFAWDGAHYVEHVIRDERDRASRTSSDGELPTFRPQG